MVNLVLCIVANIFHVYLVYKYIKIFAEESMSEVWWKKAAKGLVFAAFYLVNTGCYLAYHSAWVNFSTNLAGMCLLTIMYLKSLKKALFVTCSVYLIGIICDTAATLPFVEYQYGQELNQFYYVLAVFLFFICELLTERIVMYRRGRDAVQNLPLAMMLVPVSNIVTFCLLVYTEESSQTVLLIVSMGFLFINFLLLYLYNMLLKLFARHYENEFLKREVEVYRNQIDIIRQNEENIRLLKHDMKHHLGELRLLAAKQDVTAMQQYMDDMESYVQNAGEIMSSGNMEIDSLLNYMLKRARTSLTTVDIKIQIPEELSHSFDINVVLGNLLENAIEAAEQTEEKVLRAVIRFNRGVLKIEIENSYSGVRISTELLGKGKAVSTKKTREGHGYGLKSVRKVLEKYHGVVEFEQKNNRICAKAILYLPDKASMEP